MERVVEQRRHDGYAGVAIEWGAIGDAGLIMTMGDNETVSHSFPTLFLNVCTGCCRHITATYAFVSARTRHIPIMELSISVLLCVGRSAEKGTVHYSSHKFTCVCRAPVRAMAKAMSCRQ
jgi:hypothetical protein